MIYLCFTPTIGTNTNNDIYLFYVLIIKNCQDADKTDNGMNICMQVE